MILDAVCEGGGHTTLKQVYTRLRHMDDTIDLSSVYRTLKLFAELGLVIVAEAPNGETVYEIPKPQKHHHLICRVCGKELEIGHNAIEGAVAAVRQQYGFVVEDDHLVFHGVCAECHARGAAEPV
jgi:Fe2+ or Zn2+ uptake regulation protein